MCTKMGTFMFLQLTVHPMLMDHDHGGIGRTFSFATERLADVKEEKKIHHATEGESPAM